MIGGGSKSFKTWGLIDIATAVATGTEYLGFPTRKGNVLYINLEIQTAFFSERVRRVAEAKDVTIGRQFFEVWNLRGHRPHRIVNENHGMVERLLYIA